MPRRRRQLRQVTPRWRALVPLGPTLACLTAPVPATRRAVLAVLPRDHFACVVTSPPYFWQRDYEVVGQIGLEPSIEGYVRSVCDVMDEVRGALDRRGVLFLNLGDTYYSAKGRPQGQDSK